MTRLLPTLRCGGFQPPCFTKSSLLPRAISANDRLLARSSKRQMRRAAAISHSVSRSSNPLSAAYRGVAQLFLTSISASLADQRRTDKTSIPDWANHLPGHPAPFVRFVRTVGSSAVLLRGPLSALNYLGSIPWPKPSRSWPTIQVLFFVPGMWPPHAAFA